MPSDRIDHPLIVSDPDYREPPPMPQRQPPDDATGHARQLYFVCLECYGNFPHDPMDPGSGALCEACAQKAYDATVPVPMSADEIQAIVDSVIGKAASHTPAVDRLAVTKRHDGLILVPHFDGGWLTMPEALLLASRLLMAAGIDQ